MSLYVHQLTDLGGHSDSSGNAAAGGERDLGSNSSMNLAQQVLWRMQRLIPERFWWGPMSQKAFVTIKQQLLVGVS